MKHPDGTTIPFVSVEDLKQKEKRREQDAEEALQKLIAKQKSVRQSDHSVVEGAGVNETSNSPSPPNIEGANEADLGSPDANNLAAEVATQDM